MPGITDPAQEFFKDGLWGWVTDQWKKLIGDAAGHLQVDVVESGLPTGAATSANQATMITALQLIDDLRAALNSVATDELDVVIDGQSADVEIKQTSPADLTPGIMGWDGSAWRKLPLVWGYYDRWAENLGGTQSGAGTYTKLTTAVPSGYVYTMQFLTVRDISSAPSVIMIELSDGTSVYTLKRNASPARYEPMNWIGEIALKEGDSVRVRLTGCGDGDTIEAVAWGHKMKVAE